MACPPSKRGEMGVFYPVLGPMELSAGLGYATKFFGDGTGQSINTHARVDFPRVKQANTQEVSRWHASASPWKTTMAARSMAIRSASMTCLEGQRAESISKQRSRTFSRRPDRHSPPSY